MTVQEEIKLLKEKLKENYSEEAKEIFKELIELKRQKLEPILLEDNY
jgi:hypothetical protein